MQYTLSRYIFPFPPSCHVFCFDIFQGFYFSVPLWLIKQSWIKIGWMCYDTTFHFLILWDIQLQFIKADSYWSKLYQYVLFINSHLYHSLFIYSKMLFQLRTTSVIYWRYPKSPLILTSNNWRLYFSWLSNHWSLCKTTGGRKWQAQWQHSTLKNVKYALLPAHVHPLILQEGHSCHLKWAINGNKYLWKENMLCLPYS